MIMDSIALWVMLPSRGNDHISPSALGTFESMNVLLPFGGICDRSLEGILMISVAFLLKF